MNSKRIILNSLFYALVASIGGFLFGYHTAAISGALIYIAKEFNLSIVAQQVLVSFILIGAIIGAYVGGSLSDRIGRKKTFFYAILALFIGTIVFVITKNIFLFFTSRALIGFSIGIFSAVSPIYIAEISDPKYRGRLVSINQLFLVLGILLSNIFAYFFLKNFHWQSIFLTGLIFAFIMLILLFFIPETPSFLANNNQKPKAIKILKKVRFNIEDSEILKNSTQNNTKKRSKTKLSDLFSPSVRSAFIIGITLNIFRQVTGINIVTYYAPKIFLSSGIESPHFAMLLVASVTTVNILATLISIWLIDKVGRRPLLITSTLGMMIFLLILSASFFINPTNLPIFVMISLMGFTSSFAIGLGSVSWLINSEIYPMHIRGKANGIATFVNWVSNYLVASSFLSLIHNFGQGSTFLFFAFICFLALIFSIKKVPETKGKSFLEIQKFFKK
ncbi:MAG: Arabinose-proton symporter [Candidatus Anoxychlamydiales bacterium]|nr:Arabinose-proton symporter [Candidatus Anoxychlamydiales bacterium]